MRVAVFLPLVVLLVGGCVRALVPGAADAGVVPRQPDPILITGVTVSGRAVASEMDADGGVTLHVFVGDLLVIDGSGWEPGGAQVTVGSVPLAVQEDSSATQLKVRIQGALPHGPVRVAMGARATDSHELVQGEGLGHLSALQDRGLLEAQLAVGSAGTMSPCTRQLGGRDPPSTPPGTNSNLVMPCETDDLAAGLALSFTLGLGADSSQPVYLASVTKEGRLGSKTTVLGRVPALPAGVDPNTVWRRSLDALRPYRRSVEDPAIHVVGVETVEHGVQSDPMTMTRLVTDLGASDPVDNLWGPVFPVDQPSGGTAFLALSVEAPGIGVRVHPVVFVPEADGHLGHTVLALSLPPSAPIAVGLVHNAWRGRLLAPPDGGHAESTSLLVLTCGGGISQTLDLTVVEVDPGPTLGDGRKFNVDGMSCSYLCAAYANRSGALLATPRELVPFGDDTWLVMPQPPTGVLASFSEAPCVITTGGPAPTGTLPPPSCDGGQCPVAQAMYSLTSVQGAVTRSNGTNTYWGVASDDGRSLVWADALTGVLTDPQAEDVPVHAVSSPLEVTALVTDGNTQDLYAVPPWGGYVFTLDPGGAPSDVLGVLGAPLGAWPMPSQQQLLAVHEHALMAMDINGYPRPFVPQAEAAFTGAAAELGARGQLLGVMVGSHNAQGQAVLLRFDVHDLGVPETLFSEQLTGTQLNPVLVSRDLVVVERTLSFSGMDPDPLAPDPPCDAFLAPGASGSGGPSMGTSSRNALLHHLLLVPRGTDGPLTAPAPVPQSCGAQALALDGDARRLWGQRLINGTDIFTQEPEGFQVTVESAAVTSGMALDAAPLNLVVLPGGAVLGVVYRSSPAGYSLSCFTTQGTRVDLGPPPMLDGVWARSPDGSRLYAGTSQALLELTVAPLLENGCPPAFSSDAPAPVAVARRIGLPGTPQAFALDASGERLVWVDTASEQVGVVE